MKTHKKRYLTDTPVLYVLAHTRAQLLRSVRSATHMAAVARYESTRLTAAGEKDTARLALAVLDGGTSIMKPADRKTLFAESARIYREGLRVSLVWRAKNAPSLLTPQEARRAALYIAEDERRAA